MADFEKLSVLLPAELVRSVRDAVDGQRYAVESDVLIDALQDWEVKQQIRASKLQSLLPKVMRRCSNRWLPTKLSKSNEKAGQSLLHATAE